MSSHDEPGRRAAPGRDAVEDGGRTDWQAEALIDLDAISGNVARLAEYTTAELLVAVKADGYGHGMIPAARASLRGGASRLGVATLDEALALRAAGIDAPVLAWVIAPGLDLAAAIEADVDVSVSSLQLLDEVAAASGHAGRPATVHIKADTGMGRGGARPTEWQPLLEAAAKAQARGAVEVVGAWSHLACADEPDHPANAAQRASFAEFLDAVASVGLQPRLRHLANSAALLADPKSHYDLVRPGIAVYGYSPFPGDGSRLRPAMTVRARITQTKRVPAGHGVSYGHTHFTPEPTTLALVPLGYADGISRAASGRAQLAVGAGRYRIAGRVCMDQVVIDVGDDPVRPGDVAVFFGPDGPTAQDWADLLDTIPNEVLTSIAGRARHRYVGGRS